MAGQVIGRAELGICRLSAAGVRCYSPLGVERSKKVAGKGEREGGISGCGLFKNDDS